MIKRPTTLSELAAESHDYSEFGHNLKDFLHEFALARKQRMSLEFMLNSEPRRLATRFSEGKICDAFLAGLADYLSRVNGLNTPGWALAQNRVLEEPWFSESFPAVRLRLLRDSPSAFKERNIFLFESALDVA